MCLTLLLVAPSTTFAQSNPATAIEQFISSETPSMGDTNDPAQIEVRGLSLDQALFPFSL